VHLLGDASQREAFRALARRLSRNRR
jgi:hypothetical protein